MTSMATEPIPAPDVVGVPPTTTPDPAPADPLPTPAAPPQATATTTESGRFAVYDDTLTQFVTGVLNKKPTKAEAKAAVTDGHKFTIREV